MTQPHRAWLTRSGRAGERDSWAVENGVTPGGYGEVSDLTSCRALQDVRDVVAAAFPDNKPQANGNFAAQLWALRGRMEIGDLVVLPLKTTSQLAIGEITGHYEYRADEPDPERRHVRPVKWIRTDIPRTSVKQDLLYSLGAFSTYCEVRRNEAAARIAAIAKTGSDPGTKGGSMPPPDDDVADSDDSPVDLETFAYDRISAIIKEEFAGHRMQDLVAAVLRCQGFTCHISPEGTDGGIDILAGSGPLGMDEPRLVVQVKSEQSPVGDPVVTQLLGSVSKHSPAQGLLVAWGGITSPARKTVLDNYFRLRVWDSGVLLRQILANYPKLPEEIRADLPLKQIWIAVEESP